MPRFDWLISGQQSVNPSREAISILSGKYKGFTFVRPVLATRVLIVAPMTFMMAQQRTGTIWNRKLIESSFEGSVNLGL